MHLTSNPWKYIEIVAEVLEEFLIILAKDISRGRYNANFIEAMQTCFNPKSRIFWQKQFYLTDKAIKDMCTMHQTWRKELKVGDQVDVSITWTNEKRDVRGWVQGKIVTTTDSKLKIEFRELDPSNDAMYSRWSQDIAQFESKTKEIYAWKKENLTKELKVKTIDCHDERHWYKSTILDFMTDTEMRRTNKVDCVHVAYRIYTETSNDPNLDVSKVKSDSSGNLYVGWDDTYDEWIPIYSP